MLSALNKYGWQKQADIAIEEMSELTKALIKDRRYGTLETLKDIYEEIADVLIIVEQLRWAFFPESIDYYVNQKLERLEERLREEATDEQGDCFGNR